MHMKDIYMTSTLKAEWNKEFNSHMCEKLEAQGIVCYLPQRNTDQKSSPIEKYTKNIEGLKEAKKILAIGINESINRWLEVAYAFGIGKKIIVLTSKDHDLPVMSLGMYEAVLRVENLDDIDSYLGELITLISR